MSSLRCALAVLCISLGATSVARAQNPTWNGKPFQRIFINGDTVTGTNTVVRATDAVLTPAGVYVFSKQGPPKGVFFISPTDLQSVVNDGDAGFSGVLNWLPVGILDTEKILFLPSGVAAFPTYEWGGGALGEFAGTGVLKVNPIYRNGSVVYTDAAQGNNEIWKWMPGGTTTKLVAVADHANLGGHLDYDGTDTAYQVGQTDVDATIWVRRSDGSKIRIIGHGDPLPGVAGATYRGIPSQQHTFVDGGWIYVVAENPGASERVVFRSNGTTTEVLLRKGDPVPGEPAATVAGFELARCGQWENAG